MGWITSEDGNVLAFHSTAIATGIIELPIAKIVH